MIEIINPHIQRGCITYALFDFDGTISLIREGWQQIMIPLMVEYLMATPRHESRDVLVNTVTEYVGRSTGIQTILQMIWLAEQVRQRGGSERDPAVYKRIYVEQLLQHIHHRLVGLKAGATDPDSLMVPGVRHMLQALYERGVQCYLASGTDQPYVLDEAQALGIASYFSGIYGARDADTGCAKKALIEGIIRDNHLAGPQLAVFGDGFVEIENGKAAGSITVGVASDEVNHSGINQWKRDRLIKAGADIVIPDFRHVDELITYLFTP